MLFKIRYQVMIDSDESAFIHLKTIKNIIHVMHGMVLV